MTDAIHADATDTTGAPAFSVGTITDETSDTPSMKQATIVPPLFRVDAATDPVGANQFSTAALEAMDELLGEAEEFGLSSSKAWLVRQLMHAREATIAHSLRAG